MAWYKDVFTNKIGLQEFNLRVEGGSITDTMVAEEIWINNKLTMQDQENLHNIKAVALTGSYNDLTDKPEINQVVVNNTLTSDSITEALSAAQGKVLNDRITTEVNNLDSKIPSLGTKKYLHRIRLSIVSKDRRSSAQMFVNYYSTQSTPYTTFDFVTMTSHTNAIEANGNYNNMADSTYVWNLAILPFNGGYAYIMNGSKEIDTYTGYEDDWTIQDTVEGYIFQ